MQQGASSLYCVERKLFESDRQLRKRIISRIIGNDQKQNYRLADSIHHLGSCLMVMGLFIMGGLVINGILS